MNSSCSRVYYAAAKYAAEVIEESFGGYSICYQIVWGAVPAKVADSLDVVRDEVYSDFEDEIYGSPEDD